MKRLIIVLLIVSGANILSAQKLANNWYFGNNAGLSFESGAPVALLDGAMNTWEGCASISSETGDLLFYTDGTKVWNRNHDQMPNGFELKGNIGSTQSAIIVPKPNANNLFYIFTIDAVEHDIGGSYGINYSLVDMNLESGLGDVVASEKNINLTSPLCEKVTSVEHQNKTDTWVISQKWNTNHIYAYLVTEEGVNPTPVISIAGQVIDQLNNAIGYMKVSPDGRALVKANTGLNSVEIFDFDNTTGIASNPRIIPNFPNMPFGIEFSPNGKLLYVNAQSPNGQSLFQFDLEAGTIDDIIASKYVVASDQTGGALQLGPDNLIYIAKSGATSLSRINLPNIYGPGCDFEFATISLGGRKVRLGLPAFVQSYFVAINAEFYYEQECYGLPSLFYDNSSQDPDSVLWNFDDPGSGLDNISKINDPVHLFSGVGSFDVMLTAWKDETESVVVHTIDINLIPEAYAGDDQIILYGTSTILEGEVNFGVPPFNYLWEPADKLVQNNILNPETIPLTVSEIFTLYLSDSKNCVSEPSEVLINVSTGETLTVTPSTSHDTICRGDTVTIKANAFGGSGLYEYQWTSIPEGFSSTESSFEVTPDQPISYLLELQDSFNNSVEGSVDVFVKMSPYLDLMPGGFDSIAPNTIVVCVRDTVLLDAGSELNPEGTNYNWNNTGLNERFLTAISNGSWIETQKHTVDVLIEETNCSATDSVIIIFDFNECAIGVDEYTETPRSLIIQPNPNNGIFNIVFNEAVSNPELSILGINGQIIHEQKFANNYSKGERVEIKIDFPVKGIYLIKINSENRVYICKLLIR